MTIINKSQQNYEIPEEYLHLKERDFADAVTTLIGDRVIDYYSVPEGLVYMLVEDAKEVENNQPLLEYI